MGEPDAGATESLRTIAHLTETEKMKTLVRMSRTILIAATVVITHAARAEITFVLPTSDNYTPMVMCDHGTWGYTKTNELSFVATPVITQKMVDGLNGQGFGEHWTYTVQSGASGTLKANLYTARDGRLNCEHGCSLELLWTDVAGLVAKPWQVPGWVNVSTYQYSSPLHSGSGSDRIAPPAEEKDKLPFFYKKGDRGQRTEDGLGYRFYSTPAVQVNDHDTPHSGDYHFATYLTSWDGSYNGTAENPEIINVYGAVNWGFNYKCLDDIDPGDRAMPEPADFGIIGAGALLAGCCFARWHSRKRQQLPA